MFPQCNDNCMKFKVYILHCKFQLKPAQSVNFMALPHVWMVYEEKLHNRMNWSISQIYAREQKIEPSIPKLII